MTIIEEKYKEDIEKIKKLIKDSIIGFDGEIEISVGPNRFHDVQYKISDDLKKISFDFYRVRFPASFYHYALNLIKEIVYKLNTIQKERYMESELKQLKHFIGVNLEQRVKNGLEKGECSTIEFKETLRYDIRKNQVNKDLEFAVIKEISGFLNAHGGLLMIGVSDEKDIKGLEKDYNTLGRKKDKDEFSLHLTQLITNHIGNKFSNYWKIEFLTIDDKEICTVEIQPSTTPVFTKKANEEEFYVRKGSAARPFKISETLYYTQTHFKN